MTDTDWLDPMKRRAAQAPARPRRALWSSASGGSVIGSLEPALAERLIDARLPIAATGATAGAGYGLAAPVDPALAAIARWLAAHRLGGRWRDELLAVADASGVPVGVVERAAVRPLGITTRAVHLIGRRADGRVWVQQRALDKATDPGLWDTTMGGLMAAGESVADTLRRETAEEAGLAIDALVGVAEHGQLEVRRPVADGYMIEHIHVFEALVPDALVPVNQDGEVRGFELLDAPALRARLRAGVFTLEAGLILADWLARREIEPVSSRSAVAAEK